MLELWRKRQAADSIYFYRTTNGTEVDFIYDGSLRKFAIECKFRRFEKPLRIPALTAIKEQENLQESIVANINLSATENGIHYTPAIFIERI